MENKYTPDDEKDRGDGVAQEYKRPPDGLGMKAVYFVNYVLTIVAAFGLGFFFPQFTIGITNVTCCIVVGVIMSACVFGADLYFLMRQFV